PDDEILTGDEGRLYERFSMELEFAGAVKVALGKDGLSDDMLPRFRAAGRAAARANVPVVMHTEFGIGAVNAVDLLEKLGLSPGKVFVCHVDRQADDYRPHEEIARTGALLEYDTIARHKYHDDESESTLIRHMLSRGYKLALSLDTTSLRMKSYSGNIGLRYIIETFIPHLRKSGVSQVEIDAMTRINPASAFI
ncbi:MAG: hypothetical protein Q4D04_15860, partial [Clostridia bacterium]|nr:hypothetical protein [Clostridia bacterium]